MLHFIGIIAVAGVLSFIGLSKAIEDPNFNGFHEVYSKTIQVSIRVSSPDNNTTELVSNYYELT